METIKITEAIKQVKENVDYTQNEFQVEQEIESIFSCYCKLLNCSFDEASEEEKKDYELFYEGGVSYSWHSKRDEPLFSQEDVDYIIQEITDNG